MKNISVLALLPPLLFLGLSFSFRANAVEAKNPVSLCDRFLSSVDKDNCESRVKEMQPDWYIASVCEKQESDASFYRCLELGKTVSVSPAQLTQCEEADSDMSRIACIQRVAEKSKGQDYQRLPANDKKVHKGTWRYTL